jgi:hypothetical protein
MIFPVSSNMRIEGCPSAGASIVIRTRPWPSLSSKRASPVRAAPKNARVVPKVLRRRDARSLSGIASSAAPICSRDAPAARSNRANPSNNECVGLPDHRSHWQARACLRQRSHRKGLARRHHRATEGTSQHAAWRHKHLSLDAGSQ